MQAGWWETTATTTGRRRRMQTPRLYGHRIMRQFCPSSLYLTANNPSLHVLRHHLLAHTVLGDYSLVNDDPSRESENQFFNSFRSSQFYINQWLLKKQTFQADFTRSLIFVSTNTIALWNRPCVTVLHWTHCTLCLPGSAAAPQLFRDLQASESYRPSKTGSAGTGVVDLAGASETYDCAIHLYVIQLLVSAWNIDKRTR